MNHKWFYRWCKLVPKCQSFVRSYYKMSPNYQNEHRIEMEESKRIVNHFNLLKHSLSEREKELLTKLIERKTDDYSYTFLQETIYDNWLDVVFPNGQRRQDLVSNDQLNVFIKNTRISMGYTKTEMSELIGIPYVSYSRIEKGTQKISASIYLRFCEIACS